MPPFFYTRIGNPVIRPTLKQVSATTRRVAGGEASDKRNGFAVIKPGLPGCYRIGRYESSS